jgi:hypothetical protein
MPDFASDAPTEPLPAVTEPRGPRLPARRLALLTGASILSGTLLAAAQDWRAATADEPGFAKSAVWAAASVCLLAGALSLLAFVGVTVWTAVMAAARGADERRAAVGEYARVARVGERNRLRADAAAAARAIMDAAAPPVRSRLQVVKNGSNGSLAQANRNASGQ